MRASEGPCCDAGAAERSNAEPVSGAAPFAGNELGAAPTEALGAAPFTGGNTESFLTGAWPGRGAGNAPCAQAGPEWTAIDAAVSGTIRPRTIKAVSPA